MENTQLELQALYHKAMECYQQKEEDKHDEGLQFLKSAAEKGMPEACKLLGIIYMSGQYAPWPAKAMAAAAMWYRKAAEGGDEEAMYWLGQCYQMGIGVEADAEKAAHWTQQAKEHGFVAEEERPESDLAAQPEDEEETAKLQEPDQNEEAEHWLQEEERARRVNRKYRRMMGLGGAVIGLLIIWAVVLLSYLLLREKLQGNTEMIFLAASGGVTLLAMGIGAAAGVRKAARRIEQIAEYRKTPFYHAFGCELGRMDMQQTWCRKVYTSLSKNYYPVTYRQKEDAAMLREYRGLLYPYWIYENGKQQGRPEFVILTEKAVYVVHTRYYTGRIQGDLRDAQWSLYSDGDKDLTAQKIPNMVDENAQNMAVVKGELADYLEWPLEQVPFYNVILLNQEVDIKGLRRVSAEDDTLFVQGGIDKLRGSIGLWESRFATHNMNMQELRGAFTEAGRHFMERSGW